MKLKEIEGIRVAPGETLVLIPPSPIPSEMQRRLLDHCDRTGINLLVLPHGSRVLVKEAGQLREGTSRSNVKDTSAVPPVPPAPPRPRRPGSNPPAPAHRPAPPPNPPRKP